jgi:hypothetical protein
MRPFRHETADSPHVAAKSREPLELKGKRGSVHGGWVPSMESSSVLMGDGTYYSSTRPTSPPKCTKRWPCVHMD